MSFDLDLVCLKDGLPDTFSSKIVHQALDRFVSFQDGSHRKLSFPDGGGEMFTDYGEETDGVSISSASGHQIYDALYEILRQTHSVLIWSFGGCVVADESVIADCPEELIESLGQPIVVHSGAEIVAAVEST